MEELQGRPVWCLDLTLQCTLLRLGYGFGDDGLGDLGWNRVGVCLGATLAMIGAELTRRAYVVPWAIQTHRTSCSHAFRSAYPRRGITITCQSL